ncbi:uncharacterized protein LOC109705399 [Ananas comosus]|uniref:Uncharacterized protein LOC109705399 n=1 Tax=Ananas comosus TaxID=4615 RepID=A0A6P5EJX2_ANACO|nr:uncharacterized protein LOC109705399 [Ananas comosus]
MQCRPSLAKLDRFLVSTDLDQTYPLSKVKALPRITSDHTPITLSTGIHPPTRRFRFERVWLSKEDFAANVPCWWNEVTPKTSAILTLSAKLRHCRIRIKEWRKTNFYSISSTKRLLQEELQNIDLLEERFALSHESRDRRDAIKAQFQIILQEEEILWNTRSKQFWLEEGDSNTKFFHAVANGRKHTNAIEVIEDESR